MDEIQWWTPPALFVIVTITAAAFGAVTNLINVQISEYYYREILGWWNVAPAWPRMMLQGVAEGGILGAIGGFAFAILVAAATRFRCPLWLAGRAIWEAVLIVLACWILGGLLALILQSISPTFLRGAVSGQFVLPPDQPGQLRFAWVGGSIVGEYIGAGLGSLYACVISIRRWRIFVESQRGFDVVLPRAANIS